MTTIGQSVAESELKRVLGFEAEEKCNIKKESLVKITNIVSQMAIKHLSGKNDFISDLDSIYTILRDDYPYRLDDEKIITLATEEAKYIEATKKDFTKLTTDTQKKELLNTLTDVVRDFVAFKTPSPVPKPKSPAEQTPVKDNQSSQNL